MSTTVPGTSENCDQPPTITAILKPPARRGDYGKPPFIMSNNLNTRLPAPGTEWRLRTGRRNVVRVAGSQWMQGAACRSMWRTKGGDSVQQWTSLG